MNKVSIEMKKKTPSKRKRKGGIHVTDKNRLSSCFPDLVKEWHSTKNGTLTPDDVSYGSKMKVWWVCSICGHIWQLSIRNRTQRAKRHPTGNACPECNSLSRCFPDLVKEWHPIKNGSLIPNAVSYGSNKLVWWLCSVCGYEWEARTIDRTRGRGCHGCIGHVVTDRNRLSVLHPNLAKEWHPIKNGSLTPNDVSYGSNKLVWWLCPICGYEWDSRIDVRTIQGSGCSICNNKIPDSAYWKPWQDICEVIARLIYPDMQILGQYSGIKGIRPDIVVMDNNGNIILIIDAKVNGTGMNGMSHFIAKDIKKYSHQCSHLEFWCLWGDREDISRPKNAVRTTSVHFFRSHQLLMRINDLQARLIIARRIQIVQRDTREYLTRWRQNRSVPALPQGQKVLQ